eukprot:gb/GEZN01012784.1/.p1 GENE.gb/GEZN01012784.1/~~gb/GEZN01012784.1/.p1  ORF type:complete len:127 (-),score=21.34 gb/GEZN01012784.1/:321-701(-)
MSLKEHEDWILFTGDMKSQIAAGNGVESLKEKLDDKECQYAHFRLYAENVGNVGKGIITEANVVLQWRGPSCSPMAKVKQNQALKACQDACPANKGFVEVLGKKNLTVNNIYDRWRPGSGSKVIQD